MPDVDALKGLIGSTPQGMAIEEGMDEAQELVRLALHQLGWTKEEDYEGLIPALALAYLAWKQDVYPVLRDARLIQQQTVAVLDQLYHWLGGVGSSIEGGVKAVEDFFAHL